mmetsp:Transcript_17707/g.68694  ORF Transcript_17707/g.68694 Transcript_17707/m.68694 type:complete len:121 (-) Transcript_17707:1676-2038(-)
MLSAFRTVLSLCATTMTVLPSSRLSSASCTRCSLSESSAEVASSRMRILGDAKMARAMAMRCFCPAESWTPRSPTCVRYPCGNLDTKSWQLASLAASMAMRRPRRSSRSSCSSLHACALL